jgi:hypothetical protein
MNIISGGIYAIFRLMSIVRAAMFLLVWSDSFRVFQYDVRLPARCSSSLHMYDLVLPFLHLRLARSISLVMWESSESYFVECVLV